MTDPQTSKQPNPMVKKVVFWSVGVLLCGGVLLTILIYCNSAPSISLSGDWQTAQRNPDQSQVNGVMKITQSGTVLEGAGSDPNSEYRLSGEVVRTMEGHIQIQIEKQCLGPKKELKGSPVSIIAVIDGTNPKGPYFIHLSGLWKEEKDDPSKPRGAWEAALMKPLNKAP